MKTTHSRKPKWPKQITLGNVTVTIYRRTTPNGKKGFMLAYKQDGKRKFDSYPDEATAIQEANTKARQLLVGDLQRQNKLTCKPYGRQIHILKVVTKSMFGIVQNLGQMPRVDGIFGKLF